MAVFLPETPNFSEQPEPPNSLGELGDAIGENDVRLQFLWEETRALAESLGVFADELAPAAFILEELGVYSPNTAAHCMRVGIVSLEPAKRLGADLKQTFLAGLLHDSGKLMIPLEVLEKTGAYDDNDRRIMAQHAEFSAKIAQDYGYDPDIVAALATHHRRQLFNPTGADDNTLSFAAQFIRDSITIADHLDAATTRNDGYNSPRLIEHVRYVLEQHSYEGYVEKEALAREIVNSDLASLYTLIDEQEEEFLDEMPPLAQAA